jgi:hypothetical protein
VPVLDLLAVASPLHAWNFAAGGVPRCTLRWQDAGCIV